LSFEGTYQYTMVLPMEIEQIAYFDENIYGLQIDSSTTKVIKFNRIK